MLKLKLLIEENKNYLSKRRSSNDQNMKLYQYEKEWYKQVNTKFIDVNEKAIRRL